MLRTVMSLSKSALWSLRESNPRHPRYERGTLPTELKDLKIKGWALNQQLKYIHDYKINWHFFPFYLKVFIKN